MKRILTCYNCEKTFICEEEKAHSISYGKTKAWCNKCWIEYQNWIKKDKLLH